MQLSRHQKTFRQPWKMAQLRTIERYFQLERKPKLKPREHSVLVLFDLLSNGK